MTQVPAPLLLPGESGSVEQLTRIEAMFENAERELNARLYDILTRGPEWYREEARLRRLLDAAHAAMSDIGAALDEETLQAGLGEVYAAGATSQDGVLQQAFQWAQPHVGAVDRIARDTFGDLLQATAYVEDSTKGIIRQAAKLATGSKLTAGKTAVQAGADLAKQLRASGIGVVTYRNGARHGVGEYSKMVLRTKTAVAYNVGTLNHSVAAGVKMFEIFDGLSCGLTEHNDPETANGLVVTAEFAAAYPIAHPNCRRSFGARPDVPHSDEKPKFDPSTTAAQRADQGAFEQFLRDQQAAKRARTARTARSSASTTTKAAAPKPTRTPRVPRAEVAAPIEVVPAARALDAGDAWKESLTPIEQHQIDLLKKSTGPLTDPESLVGSQLHDLIEGAPDAGSHAFIGISYPALTDEQLKTVAEKRVGDALLFDTRAVAKTSFDQLPDDANLVLSFEKKQGPLGKLVGDGDLLVDRAKWEMTSAEVIDGKVVIHLDDISKVENEFAPPLGGKFMGAPGITSVAPTNPETYLPSVKFGENVSAPTKLVGIGKTGGAFDDFRIGGFEPVVLYDEKVGARLIDKGVGTKEAEQVALRTDAKVLKPAIDPIDYTPNTLQTIASTAANLGYDAVDFGLGSGVVVLRESALVKEVATREIRSGGLRGVQTVEAAEMRVSEVDRALRERADGALREIVDDDAKKWGYRVDGGGMTDAPTVEQFSSSAAGAMKQRHEEILAHDIASRLDDFEGMREWADHAVASLGPHGERELIEQTLANRSRARVGLDVKGDGYFVSDYGKVRVTLKGQAKLDGFDSVDEWAATKVKDTVDYLMKQEGADEAFRQSIEELEVRRFLKVFEDPANLTTLDNLSLDNALKLGYPGHEEAMIERRVGQITNGWAGSSGDTSANAIALQETAATKFGVSTDSMHKGLDALHRNYRGDFGNGPEAFNKEVANLLARDGPIYEAYLDAAYEETQRILAEKGIDEVVLVRGMRFGGTDNPEIPEALLDLKGPEFTRDDGGLGKRVYENPALPDSQRDRGGYGDTKVVQAIGNPLQSWSTVPAVSERFASGGQVGAMMQAKVGAGRILAFPATGPGCLSEFEWVLIGIDDVPVTLSRI